MKFSYDYEELLQELYNDLEEWLIEKGGFIYIKRDDEPILFADIEYYPIIDYYYSLEDIVEAGAVNCTQSNVDDVVEEMEYNNSVL